MGLYCKVYMLVWNIMRVSKNIKTDMNQAQSSMTLTNVYILHKHTPG